MICNLESGSKFGYLNAVSLAVDAVLDRYMSLLGSSYNKQLYLLTKHYIESSIKKLSDIESKNCINDITFRQINNEFSFRDKIVIGFDQFYTDDGKIGSFGCLFLNDLHDSFKLLIYAVYTRKDLSFLQLYDNSIKYVDSLVSPFQISKDSPLNLPIK